MNEQEQIGKCAMTIALVMEEYAKLGTDDCYFVNTHLKEAMGLIAGHLTISNQDSFSDWLLKKTEGEKK